MSTDSGLPYFTDDGAGSAVIQEMFLGFAEAAHDNVAAVIIRATAWDGTVLYSGDIREEEEDLQGSGSSYQFPVSPPADSSYTDAGLDESEGTRSHAGFWSCWINEDTPDETDVSPLGDVETIDSLRIKDKLPLGCEFPTDVQCETVDGSDAVYTCELLPTGREWDGNRRTPACPHGTHCSVGSLPDEPPLFDGGGSGSDPELSAGTRTVLGTIDQTTGPADGTTQGANLWVDGILPHDGALTGRDHDAFQVLNPSGVIGGGLVCLKHT